MKALFARIASDLRAWRKGFWDVLTGSDEATWGAHLALVFLGSALPFGLVAPLAGLWVGVVVGFAASELWLLYFAGREVSDFILHRMRGDKAHYVRDGLGDLAGPLVVHVAWWLALIFLLLR